MVDDQRHDSALNLSGGALAALLSCGLFTTIGLFAPGLVLPQIARAFAGMPHAGLLTHLVGAVASFSFAIGAPFAGMLVARRGCRRVILPSLILFAIVGTAPALLNDLWAILATRVVLGLALAGIFTGGLAGIAALPNDRRARMFGWYSVVGGGVSIVMFPIIGLLARSGWHLPFVVHLVAVAVAPLTLLLPIGLGLAEHAPSDSEAAPSNGMSGWATICLLVMAALIGMSMFIGPMYAPHYLGALGINDTRLLAIPVTLGSIAAAVSSAGYGFLHRRLGLAGVSASVMLVMGCALLVAGSAETIPLFTVAIIVHSAAVAVLAPHVSATALAYSPAGKGSQAMGLANGVMFGSQLLFPFLASWISVETSIRGVFLAFGVAALAIALVIAALPGVARRRPLVV